jgi:hypothetical protein
MCGVRRVVRGHTRITTTITIITTRIGADRSHTAPAKSRGGLRLGALRTV